MEMFMEQTIFSGTLGLSPPWQVTEVTFARESNRLDIKVEYEPRDVLTCPSCGARGQVSCLERDNETWFHEDFFHYATYLHALVPRLTCCCGSFPRPWSRAGSRFARIL
jgi:transposase